jgi:hypothetical protein
VNGRSRRNRSIKLAVNYDDNVPRCDSCVHFRQAGLHLVNSLPRHHRARCVKHEFEPKACGVCDTWKSRDGDVLLAN